MLTRLRFKNWRSLRDVTIDNLTPITVFVGANSSGKTNILDGLHFLRQMLREDAPKSTYFKNEPEKFRTLGIGEDEAVEIEVSIQAINSPAQFSYVLSMKPEGGTIHFEERIHDTTGFFHGQAIDGVGRVDLDAIEFEQAKFSQPVLILPSIRQIFDVYRKFYPNPYLFVTQNWQLLRENFTPPSSQPSRVDAANTYVIEPDASNLPLMLNFMQQDQPELYEKLEADLRWLLNHVDNLRTERTEHEIRFSVQEKPLQGREAPTVSAGTSRLIAMLAAYYALDMRNPDTPGLVVIEEPDTAIHPLLLRKIVDLLRLYTEDNENPRQFILTTHNPMLLNLFKPEEVRIVERNEQGETTVSHVSQEVLNVAFEKYGDYRIGDVWTTRVLGGVPE